MSKIKSIKLVSGEELVAEIMEDKPELTIKNPVACVMQRSEKGPVLGFMPWMQSSNGPFTIEMCHILLMAEVADEVKDGYNQIFGAGIVLPSKDLILG